MKTLLLFVTLAALAMPTFAQTCPQDPKVGNPINFAHLFKEQTDLHFDFYNTKTSYALVYQDNIALTAATLSLGSRQRIVFRITDSSLPIRSWLYMVDIRFDVNGFINQIDRFGKVRSDGVATADQAKIQAFFADPTIFVSAVAGNCCLAKLEYINFYYLFANYYKNGLGLTQPACT